MKYSIQNIEQVCSLLKKNYPDLYNIIKIRMKRAKKTPLVYSNNEEVLETTIIDIALLNLLGDYIK